MPWGDTLPSIATEQLTGWFNNLPAPPNEPQTGWWAGLDLDDVITIQWVTHAELMTLKDLNMVLAVNVDRSLVLRAIRIMAFERGLTVTMNLGLQGVYFLSADRSVGVNRTMVLANVQNLALSRSLSVNAAMQLGHVADLGATQSLWTMNRVTGLTHIVPLDYPQTLSFNAALTVLPIHVQDFAQTLTINRSMDLVLVPNKKVYQDTFNRANQATVGNASDGSGAWVNRYKSSTNPLKIVTNGVACGTASSMSVESFPASMATADQEVVLIITGNYINLNQIVIGLRGDTTKIGTYCVLPWGSTATIKTHTSWSIGSGGASGTNRVNGSAAPSSFTAGNKWRFRAVGDVYTLNQLTSANVITGTNPYATWNDSGQLSDRTGRLVSMGLNMTSTTANLFDQFDAIDI